MGIDAASVAAGFDPRLPVRAIGGVLTAIGVGLAVAWTGMWAAHVFAGHPTPVDPEAFKIVAALDLSLMVPALVVGGVLLWRREPWGYVIATLASVQGALYLLVLLVNSVLVVIRGLVPAPGEGPLWGALALVTGAIAARLLAAASANPRSRSVRLGGMNHQVEGMPAAKSNRREVTHVARRETTHAEGFGERDYRAIDEAEAKIREVAVDLHRP